MPEPIFINFGMYIMALELISMAYFTNSSRQSQSYFTTGGLPLISLSWRQAPCGPRPEIFSTEPLRSWSLCNIVSDKKMGLIVIWLEERTNVSFSY
jgi:hypothetical protein